jgi:hypothetical protein
VLSDANEQSIENRDVSVKASTRKRRAEEVEADREEFVSEALSVGPVEAKAAGSASHPVVLSSSSDDHAHELSGPERDAGDAVEAALRFDADEEYARQLQEEEYAAAGALGNPFADMAMRVVKNQRAPNLILCDLNFPPNLGSAWISTDE